MISLFIHIPPRRLTGVHVHIEHILLLSPLGDRIRTVLEKRGATVDSTTHSIEYAITWEPHGATSVLVVINKSMPFQRHAQEIQWHFPGRHILYVVQGLDDIDQELVKLQMTVDCLIEETHDAKETTQCIAQWLTDVCVDQQCGATLKGATQPTHGNACCSRHMGCRTMQLL